MFGRLSHLGCLVALVASGGCVSYHPVPLRDGAFPRGAVQVGDHVRVQTAGGESLSFDVAQVEGSALTSDSGRRIEPGELTSLAIERFNKRRTVVALSVVGGVIVTALALEQIDEEIEACFGLGRCED